MSKDIVVFLPSRDNPKGCDDTIKMLYQNSHSAQNFDIVCIVDNDQIELYSNVIQKWPMVIWKHPEHKKNSFVNLNKIHFDFIESTDYYFNWWVVDDFSGLRGEWDSAIINKKGLFDDGYYTLFTNNPMGRNLNALTSQFKKAWHWSDGDKKPMVVNPVELIYHYHEMLPICTKKWRLALKHFFDKHDGGDHVFLNASLAHVLSFEFNYSRNIEVNFYYENIVDNYNAAKILHGGLTRDQHFYKMAREDSFKTVRIVANEISNEIWQHYRDRMDKPRGIGKYKNEQYSEVL
jgi:hypothetical protein